MNTKNIVVYDNGGETYDRYTVLPYLDSDDINERVIYLGMSEGGIAFSMWGELTASDLDDLTFLGKLRPWVTLRPCTQQHIVVRVTE